jgi:hypothetical protein
MQQNSNTMAARPPAWTLSGAPKTTSLVSELKSKPIPQPTPNYFQSSPPPPPPPPPPPTLPPVTILAPPVQNGRLTNTDAKPKATINAYYQMIQSHRLNGNTITNNNINDTTPKSNQSSRRPSKDRHSISIPSSSKQPPPRMMVY